MIKLTCFQVYYCLDFCTLKRKMLNLPDSLKKYWHGFEQLFFPELCITCGDKLLNQEKFICLRCLHDIPRTRFYDQPENKVIQLFWGRVKTEYASSFFFYRKGSRYQKLIHHLKYKGLKELGYETGRLFGSELAESSTFPAVDLIVPVPLHPKKFKKRGYNQSEWIAMGIGNVLNIPVCGDNLRRLVFTSTQTRKTRFERWENVEGIFELFHPQLLANKHILLVDDVVTTGSTLEACAAAIQKAPDVKVSIVTLGYADY